MSEEEKKAIEDSKELIKDLKNNKDKDFIGRLYYKGKPVEENIEILVNLIEKLQKENEEKDKIIFQVKDYVEPLITQYEDTKDYSIKEYCKNYIVNELLKGIFNKKYVYKGILREMITKPTIITDNGDYISIDKIIELLEEE